MNTAIINTTATATHAAAPVPPPPPPNNPHSPTQVPEEVILKFEFRRSKNIVEATIQEKVPSSVGYNGILGIALDYYQQNLEGRVNWNKHTMLMRPSARARQKQFVVLNEENVTETIHRAWKNSRARKTLVPPEEFKICVMIIGDQVGKKRKRVKDEKGNEILSDTVEVDIDDKAELGTSDDGGLAFPVPYAIGIPANVLPDTAELVNEQPPHKYKKIIATLTFDIDEMRRALGLPPLSTREQGSIQAEVSIGTNEVHALSIGTNEVHTLTAGDTTEAQHL